MTLSDEVTDEGFQLKPVCSLFNSERRFFCFFCLYSNPVWTRGRCDRLL